ncbi:hypothetical protein Nepgr_027464 [Nepenthes gracilis]|uniref:non-specific serine/threonine protein kinase n=1 Tax=Nepenthes gracilis TaxID=150966 RepID=A0AAD3Y3K0_NEPGR|nr:hypothetical protein Nepgr_027464 [Nepenthes gracilis]
MEDDAISSVDTDLDVSFTSRASTATEKTLTSSSARSSLTLSFNERLSVAAASGTSTSNHQQCRPHRRWDPRWSAIRAVTNLSFDGRLHLRHLKLLRHLGTGELGRVFLCRLRDCHHSDANAHFALKAVDSDSLSPKKLSHFQTEARILSMLDHPFLPTLYAHIEVSHYTCLLIDYCPGGDLHSLLHKQFNNRLPAQAVKFYAAEVLLALEYLHALGIVYRDLKPENICSEKMGTSIEKNHHPPTAERCRRRSSSCFSGPINKRQQVEEVGEFVAEPTAAFSKSCVGTHEYLAPELASGNGHGSGVDWWAFGVLIYELLYGTTPFKGLTKKATLRNIASTRKVAFRREEGEECGAAEARDLIEKLLVKDPRRRLGSDRGAADIKRHPFFDGVKWPLIMTYRPPECRGRHVCKSMSHVGGSGGLRLQKKRRRRWWKGLCYYLKKSKGSTNTYHVCMNSKLRKFA